jgi:hypothetical protein
MQRDPMTKTIPEITDEMVERGARYFRNHLMQGVEEAHRIAARKVLALALTPEPEIEVTEAMRRAGAMATEHMATKHMADFACSEAEAIYRAMVKAAPSGAKSAPQGVSAAAPEKATGDGVEGLGRLGIEQNPNGGIRFSPGTRYSLQLNCMVHRRSTDPNNGMWKINRRSTDPK